MDQSPEALNILPEDMKLIKSSDVWNAGVLEIDTRKFSDERKGYLLKIVEKASADAGLSSKVVFLGDEIVVVGVHADLKDLRDIAQDIVDHFNSQERRFVVEMPTTSWVRRRNNENIACPVAAK